MNNKEDQKQRQTSDSRQSTGGFELDSGNNSNDKIGQIIIQTISTMQCCSVLLNSQHSVKTVIYFTNSGSGEGAKQFKCAANVKFIIKGVSEDLLENQLLPVFVC